MKVKYSLDILEGIQPSLFIAEIAYGITLQDALLIEMIGIAFQCLQISAVMERGCYD